jgi:hypothetical protein
MSIQIYVHETFTLENNMVSNLTLCLGIHLRTCTQTQAKSNAFQLNERFYPLETNA